MASLSILQIGYRLDNSKKTEEELLDEKDRRDELRGWDPNQFECVAVSHKSLLF